MPTFAEEFNLSKTQAQLDFVDVRLGEDLQVFIEPMALSQRLDPWSVAAHQSLVSFFATLIDALRKGEGDTVMRLLGSLSEPSETYLGFSRGRSKGAGIGAGQAKQIRDALASSAAVKSGFLTSLEDCELMIRGIGPDKISDLTTNVIRHHLVAYTRQQAALWNVPMSQVPLAPQWDETTLRWQSKYESLPVWQGRPVLLVPKAAVRISAKYNSRDYYRNYVLDFLRREELQSPFSALVTALKNGSLVVRKKDLEEKYPFSKEFLYEFSKKHPEVLAEYRRDTEADERKDRISEVDERHVDAEIAEAIAQALPRIPTGSDHATAYHDLMLGAVEFIFYPVLGFPEKEVEINEGRKRIDIRTQNCARSGILYDLHAVSHVPCSFVHFECKNYKKDVANPELDQLAGRMNQRHGMVGFVCCRALEDRDRFVQRCRDSYGAMGQIIVPLDDVTVLAMLREIAAGRRAKLDEMVRTLINEIRAS